jgi:hypothetical protein
VKGGLTSEERPEPSPADELPKLHVVDRILLAPWRETRAPEVTLQSTNKPDPLLHGPIHHADALNLRCSWSCHRFRANEVRLQLSVLAYNLGNLWRRLVLPKRIWALPVPTG